MLRWLSVSLAVLLPATAAAEYVPITPDDCARIVAHVPAPDVAYRPGVDVDGNAVAPADLDDVGRLDLDGEDVVVEIAVPLRAFPGTVNDQIEFEAEGGAIDRFDAAAQVGAVTVRDGNVYFNGRLISKPDLKRYAAVCHGR